MFPQGNATRKALMRHDSIPSGTIWYVESRSQKDIPYTFPSFMMTSSNGTIFPVTGHLCGKFTGLRWLPRTKASDAELWCFCLICVWINGRVNNREAGDLRRYRAHYDVTVMSGSVSNLYLAVDACFHVSDSTYITWHQLNNRYIDKARSKLM